MQNNIKEISKKLNSLSSEELSELIIELQKQDKGKGNRILEIFIKEYQKRVEEYNNNKS